MKGYFILFLLLIMMFFNGCIGLFEAVPDERTKVGSDTKEKVRTTRNRGEPIINKYDYTELKGIRVLENFEDSNMMGSITIKKNEFAQKYIDSDTEEIYYCGTYYKPMGSEELQKVCFIEEYDEIDSYFVVYKSGNYVGPSTLSNPISFKKSHSEDKGKSYRKMELLYDGVERGMILFTYREFTDASVRPAFYSQVRYLLNKNRATIITYRSAKIKVYRATNNSITYEILKPLSMEY
ncbi:MAG: hypothetical protein U9P38_00470 [Campylobacterota bacterium]|nr:hypothetical protein [Campylobacterota bacterium]